MGLASQPSTVCQMNQEREKSIKILFYLIFLLSNFNNYPHSWKFWPVGQAKLYIFLQTQHVAFDGLPFQATMLQRTVLTNFALTSRPMLSNFAGSYQLAKCPGCAWGMILMWVVLIDTLRGATTTT